MYFRIRYPYRFAYLILFTVLFASPSLAKQKKPDDLFAQCPVGHAVRISDQLVTSRYSVLANCSGQLIEGAIVPLPDRSPIMRIEGVKDEVNRNPKRGRGAGRGSNRSTAASALPPLAQRPFALEIQQAAAAHRIDPLFLHAVIRTESAYRPQSVSPAGAVGLMQIMPATGTMLGVARHQLLEPSTNIDAGARYLKQLQRRYGRDFELILSAYNAGPGAVARHGNKIPPYRETRAYVRKVVEFYDTLRQSQVAAGGAWSQ